MGKRILNDQLIKRFRDHLIEREMSGATVEKYCRDVTAFTRFANGDAVCKTLVIINGTANRIRFLNKFPLISSWFIIIL